MTLSGPPPDIPPPRLFRLLLATPRPVLPLSLRIAGIPCRLSVQGLRSSEICEANDDAEAIPLSLRQSYATAGIVARALLADGKPAFTSAADVLDMPDAIASQLMRYALNGIGTVSPVYGWMDYDAWNAALCAGAKHPSNYTAAKALGHCYHVAYGLKHTRVLEMPELYFGMPRNELTDGHWMVYRAARTVLEERYT